jgi:hypothetical protein
MTSICQGHVTDYLTIMLQSKNIYILYNKIKDVTGHDTLPALSEAASSPVFSSSLSPRVFIKEEDCGEANVAIVDPLLFGQWMVSGQP